MTRPRALIIGGSVGGVLAANLLRNIGWDVAVFERTTSDLSDRGAGIGTRDELFAVLRRAGVRLDASIGVEARARLCLDRGGAVVHEVPLRSISSSWARVYRPLRAALPSECYRAGALLDRIEQDATGVTAIFADGAREHGDLLIGADGLHSTVRRQFLPDVQPTYAGYVAWRGVADERTVPPALHATIFNHLTFCFPDEGMLLCTPMPGPEGVGARRCQFVWFRPVDKESLPLLCTDAGGQQHGLSIPPPLIRTEVVNELRASARAAFSPQIAMLVSQTAQPMLAPIFDLESPKLVFGRVLLLGDAAFVARPHVATGVTKAALDAQGIADALATEGDLESALTRYDRERRKFGQWLVARGRHIGARLKMRLRAREGGETALRQPNEVVMREYGASGVVGNEPSSGARLGLASEQGSEPRALSMCPAGLAFDRLRG